MDTPVITLYRVRRFALGTDYNPYYPKVRALTGVTLWHDLGSAWEATQEWLRQPQSDSATIEAIEYPQGCTQSTVRLLHRVDYTMKGKPL